MTAKTRYNLKFRARMILLAALVGLVLFGPANAEAITNDVTADVEVLGTPFASLPVYARNVWSMFPYQGLLYLGYGNASNLQPDPYSGEVSVIAFNPANSAFTNQYTMNEQQIDHYRIFNGQLVTPGFNPNALSNNFGDYYIKEANSWAKIVNIPAGTHTFDMLEYTGLWFAALGSFSNILISSTNDGTNWQGALSTNLATLGNTSQRDYSLFQLGGTLYSMTLVLLPDFNLAPTLLRYDTNQGFFVTNSYASADALTNFCPDTSIPLGSDYCIARTTNVNQTLAYILGVITNDMQWSPMGLYWATNVNFGNKVNLPSGAKAWDILQDSTGVWVLESTPVSGSTNYWVQVVGSQDFVNWREVLRFQTNTFARSFALLDGDFYFGLGCETNALPTNTGTILRVQSEYFSPSMESAQVISGSVQVSAQSPSDQDLVLQRSVDLQNWVSISTNATVQGIVSWTDENLATNGGQYYRCLIGP